MDVREWALIAFSILIQMSVGSFLVLGVVHLFAARRASMEQADQLSDRALLAIGPVLALAFLASLFHLGNPFNAYLAVTNLWTSWLSREILFGVLFFVIGGAFAWMQWRKIGTFGVRNVVAWLAAIVGVAMVYSMASVYLLPTQPAWDNLATPLGFFVTTLLLGVLAIGATLVANYAFIQRRDPACAEVQCTLLRSVLRWMALASLVLLGLELIAVPLQIAYLAAGGPAAAESATMFYGQYNVVLAMRLVLVFLGAGILATFIYQNVASPGRERIAGNLTYAAFALVLVAEVLGRFLFYAVHVRIGI